ncbi:hypothetical protein PIB30_098916 [Stylosanthes scabra]|uniref:Ubiquitin-like protease family profile domain-containing protein n=1 Tax=Stylosanthes scabra TaxID=79078 RepID=A0ABU6SX53_9FABA|nr:hypothetical protein [Stylosanthes scabra]
MASQITTPNKSISQYRIVDNISRALSTRGTKLLTRTLRGTSSAYTLHRLVSNSIMNQVIDLVVEILADEKDILRWFQPTEFMHMALHPLDYDESRIDYMRERYMGKYENVSKNGHWFLLVIDAQFDTMTYYDSLKNAIERPGRIKMIKAMANFLQLILDDRRFFEHSITKKPVVSKFKFIEAETPQQQVDTNNGGIWVAERMRHSYMWEGYLDKVDEKTGMSLALELIMGKNNRKANRMPKMAKSTWDKIVCRAASTEKRKRRKFEEKETQHSPSTSI